MDIDLRSFGYAPGFYGGTCSSCGTRDLCMGWDKRSWNCKTCAMKLFEEHKIKIDSPLICDYDEITGKIQ